MKTKQLFILPTLFIAPVLGFSASIEAEYQNPDDYTDFSVYGLSEEKTLRIFKAEFSEAAENMAKKHLAEDQTLKITFTDIDMAGDIQPWRNTDNADIRYIEAVYPPRLKFTYQLLDSEGNVIKEGEDSISDLSYQTNIAATIRGKYESFFYEMELLEGWMRNTLKAEKKSVATK